MGNASIVSSPHELLQSEIDKVKVAKRTKKWLAEKTEENDLICLGIINGVKSFPIT